MAEDVIFTGLQRGEALCFEKILKCNLKNQFESYQPWTMKIEVHEDVQKIDEILIYLL
jgi:hypothetical protein